MARVDGTIFAAVILGSMVLTTDALAARRTNGLGAVGLANRSLPASPVDIKIDKNWAKSDCGFLASGGTSASGSCSTNASTKVSTSSTTTPTSSTSSFTQNNSASSKTTASATGPGSIAAGGGSSSAGTLSARIRIN